MLPNYKLYDKCYVKLNAYPMCSLLVGHPDEAVTISRSRRTARKSLIALTPGFAPKRGVGRTAFDRRPASELLLNRGQMPARLVRYFLI